MKRQIKKRLQQVYGQILKRPIPHTLVSWRFLLPNQSWKVKLHRRVCLNAWPRLPRMAWLVIFIYSSAAWLLWYGWKQLFRGFKHNHKLVRERYAISPVIQLTGLLKAAFLYGIPAYAYYQFRLFKYPENQWFDFVYTHEHPHWHSVLSPHISAETQQLLTDKAYFADHLSQRGLATIPTLQKFKRGQLVGEDDLFSEKSCFLKPNIGSRGEGCLILKYEPKSRKHELTGDNINKKIDQTSSILEFVSQQVKQRDYIVQPLLMNHPLIQQFSPNEMLVTLRLITANTEKQKPQVVSALLEIPSPENAWWLIAIDCETGNFIDSTNNWFDPKPSFIEAMQNMAGEAMPFWTEIVSLCKDAHQQCEGIITIGWDVVMTPDGVHLLEGNINWGTAQHQMAYGVAMLNSARVGCMPRRNE